MGMLNLPIVKPRRIEFNPRDYPHINDLPQFKIRDIRINLKHNKPRSIPNTKEPREVILKLTANQRLTTGYPTS